MNQQQVNLASALLFVAIVACSQALASPMGSHQSQNQDQDELASNEDVAPSMGPSRNQAEPDNEFGGTFTGPMGGYSDSADMSQQQSPSNYNSNGNGFRNSAASNQQHQAQASENNENQADDEDANEDEDSAATEIETSSNLGRRAAARALAEGAQPWLESSQLASEGVSPIDASELDGALGADSNIANAKIEMSPHDRATAAGHHHHHGHYVSGMLKMGAETGKKGAFKWHDKHPVGGKGRR